MTLPTDPLEILKWVFDRTADSGWLFGAVAIGIAWTWKRMRDWGRRNAVQLGSPKGGAPAPTVRWAPDVAAPAAAARPAAATYAAAPSYAAAAYAAQPAYAAPPAPAQSGGHARKLHREGAPPQRAAAPAAQRTANPAAQPAAAASSAGGFSLSGAFGDPAHARTAIVIAEVLGPPVALR